MKADDRTPLRKAVDRLIADGKLKQDKDLQEIFNLSKSTISAYLNNPKPGKRFINEFEKKFGISLIELEPIETKALPANDHTDLLRRHIDVTHRSNELLLRLLDEKITAIETNLNEIRANQAAAMVLLQDAVVRAAIYRYGADKKKLDNELNEINKAVASALK